MLFRSTGQSPSYVSPSLGDSRMPIQDCAGSILYSTEKAIEVALEGMQCLGGNGYINGQSLDLSFIRTATLTYDYPSSRSWVALRHVLPRA